MTQQVDRAGESPEPSVPDPRRREGPAEGSLRSRTSPGAAASDAQILALVEAAQRLGRRQRERCAGVSTPASDERLLALDWAVRAGRRVLADRAAR
jgi:hypothetical protein